jgi:hypothetical protein
MIPDNKLLRQRLTVGLINDILLSPTNYFELADEYVSLQRIFSRDTLLEKLELWMEMIISPLMMFAFSFFKGESPDILSILSLQKCITLWKDWFRMRELRDIMQKWIRIIRTIGGPFIASNDAEYHMFVYADGMQRLHDSLFLITKESAKRSK